ncbi:MAG: transcription antitermination factor NusB [Nitriliruptor sp.]
MSDPHDPVTPAATGERSDAPDAGASPRAPKPAGKRRVDTRDPRRARERALKILFQADIRGVPAGDVLARIVDDPRAWAILDDLDPEGAADLTPTVDAADAYADAEPHEVAAAARRRRARQLDGFTRSLVQGVADNQPAIDDLIQRYARRWTVARMPAIDRCVLRLGTYELAFETTSAAVVINEVIELAKNLSTEDSGRYVNGVLESVRKHLADQPLTAAADTSPSSPSSVSSPSSASPARIDPVVPDTAVPPPFEGEPEPVDDLPVLEGDEIVELLDAEPVDDVLPPPDDEGEAVDLVIEPDPLDTEEVAEADETDAADGAGAGELEGAGGPDDADEGPGDAQQQLF